MAQAIIDQARRIIVVVSLVAVTFDNRWVESKCMHSSAPIFVWVIEELVVVGSEILSLVVNHKFVFKKFKHVINVSSFGILIDCLCLSLQIKLDALV